MAGRLVVDDTSDDANELLQELTMRFIGGIRSDIEGYPMVFVGDLDHPTPAKFPMPPKARIIGTVARSPESLKVFAQVKSDPEQVIEFYESELPSDGWEKDEPSSSQNGFVRDSLRDRASATFSHRALGYALYLNSWAVRGPMSEFILRLEPKDHAELHPRIQASRELHDDMFGLLPTLYPPAGTWKSGGRRHWRSGSQ